MSWARLSACMLISHKGHTDTIQVYSVTVMTHVKALQAGHSSQGTSEPITPVPKRNMYILFFDRKSGQYVSKHRHFTMVWYVKGISAKILASKRAISVFFVIIHQQQKTRFLHVHLSVRPCSETNMSLFRNMLVININAMKGTKIVIIYNV